MFYPNSPYESGLRVKSPTIKMDYGVAISFLDPANGEAFCDMLSLSVMS